MDAIQCKDTDMEHEDIASRLARLASDDLKRTETARLRDIFPSVERTLRAGVSQDTVLAELHAAGFKMTKASFKSALQRIRKEKGITKSVSYKTPQTSIPTTKGNDLADPKKDEVKTADTVKSRRPNVNLDDY